MQLKFSARALIPPQRKGNHHRVGRSFGLLQPPSPQDTHSPHFRQHRLEQFRLVSRIMKTELRPARSGLPGLSCRRYARGIHPSRRAPVSSFSPQDGPLLSIPRFIQSTGDGVVSFLILLFAARYYFMLRVVSSLGILQKMLLGTLLHLSFGERLYASLLGL